jgi:hypothetical protein
MARLTGQLASRYRQALAAHYSLHHRLINGDGLVRELGTVRVPSHVGSLS